VRVSEEEKGFNVEGTELEPQRARRSEEETQELVGGVVWIEEGFFSQKDAEMGGGPHRGVHSE
jgi:hypothetical protein